MARGLAAVWPEAAEVLARRYWPGPLTLVVPKRSVGSGHRDRGPAHGGAAHAGASAGARVDPRRGVPIAAPSANRFTELSPTAAEHVPGQLADFVLDGGPARVGIESTVLSLDGAPLLLRPGVIPLPEIEALIGPVTIAAAAAEGPHASPGMHPRHYRPATPLYLIAPGDARRRAVAHGCG